MNLQGMLIPECFRIVTVESQKTPCDSIKRRDFSAQPAQSDHRAAAEAICPRLGNEKTVSAQQTGHFRKWTPRGDVQLSTTQHRAFQRHKLHIRSNPIILTLGC